MKEGGEEKPRDLSGYTGSMTIIPAGSTEPWLTISSTPSETGSGITFGGETGLVDLLISSTDTYTINWKRAKFVLKVINNVFEQLPLIVGQFSAQGPY